ncbi:MAG: class I SAM-dependent methyltransferase [Verrucomicrobiota bacterium]|nr:class I SAM-dependent methyltransferase [Verrucomicrobiota bacterium]
MYANPQEIVDCVELEAEQIVPDPNDFSVQQYREKQKIQLADNIKALEVLNGFAPQRGKLLEVGSFMGYFLRLIRESGWDVTGVELVHWAAEFARQEFQLTIHEKLLSELAFPEGYFDAVMMLHVIEHMPDPLRELRELRRITRTGGHLVVETPRFDSLMFKILGRRERNLSTSNGHIFFFEVPTLTKLLEKAGYEVLRVDLVGRTMSLDRFIGNLGLILRYYPLRKLMSRISQASFFTNRRVHINVRDMQRFYCRAK